MSRFGIDLDRHEQIVALLRKRLRSQAAPLFLAAIWIFVPFLFFFPLLALGGFGLLFFALFEISGLLYAARRWRMWQRTVLILTDKRILDVDQNGFFSCEVSEISYPEVRDVEVVGGRLRIRTKKTQGFDIEFRGIKNPKRVADLILEVQYLRQSHDTQTTHSTTG